MSGSKNCADCFVCRTAENDRQGDPNAIAGDHGFPVYVNGELTIVTASDARSPSAGNSIPPSVGGCAVEATLAHLKAHPELTNHSILVVKCGELGCGMVTGAHALHGRVRSLRTND